jgi:hypothetical protein
MLGAIGHTVSPLLSRRSDREEYALARCAGKAGRLVSAMRFPSPSQRLAHPQRAVRGDDRTGRAAAALLGEGHPLVVVLGRIEMLGDQLVVVATAHAGGLVLSSLQAAPGVAVVIAAVAFEVVLGCRLFLLEQRRRQECVALIAEGREDLPLDAVARERGRLASPRNRKRLARAIEELARPRPFGAHPRSARPPLAARVVGPVRPQLHELAQQLVRDDVSTRGVALLELLISSPMSALYGSEPERLKREVGRARYLLVS